jgi:hypothetical protein
MRNRDSKYLRTRSLYLAAFLFAKGAELVGLGEFGDGRVTLSFVRSPESEIWACEFKSGRTVSVDARLYLHALKFLSRERQELLMRIHARENRN